jgi:hypothetical protein
MAQLRKWGLWDVGGTLDLIWGMSEVRAEIWEYLHQEHANNPLSVLLKLLRSKYPASTEAKLKPKPTTTMSDSDAGSDKSGHSKRKKMKSLV